MTLSMSAQAKISLDLRVFDRRKDGYHEVRILQQTIDLTDEVRAEPSPVGDLRLEVQPRGVVPSGGDNLVIRAANALRTHSGIVEGARLTLVKNIPVGAGLGGGSSDAATTLLLLDQLWHLQLEKSELERLAARLGSDVPFFLTGGLALATGRGDLIQPLPDLHELGVVLCSPPFEVSTADAYRLFSDVPRLTSTRSKDTVDTFVAASKGNAVTTLPWQDLENDLEPAVFEKWPDVGRAVTALQTTSPLHAGMTGSGASAYAVYPDLETAERAASGIDDRWDLHVAVTTRRTQGRQEMEETEGEREEFV
ncbi:MAG: 4-(cytidine 5'-diphospho)-2-C-methyl-D-erythritol kinase [Acidobacteriota bacterium]